MTEYEIIVPIPGLELDKDVTFGSFRLCAKNVSDFEDAESMDDYIEDFSEQEKIGYSLSEGLTQLALSNSDFNQFVTLRFFYKDELSNIELSDFSKDYDDNLLKKLLHIADRAMDYIRYKFCNIRNHLYIYKAGIINDGFGGIYLINRSNGIGKYIGRKISEFFYCGLSIYIDSDDSHRLNDDEDDDSQLIKLTQCNPIKFDEIDKRLAVALRAYYENNMIGSSESVYKSIITSIEFLIRKNYYERIDGVALRERIAKFAYLRPTDINTIVNDISSLLLIRNKMTHNIKYFEDLGIDENTYLKNAELYFLRIFNNILTLKVKYTFTNYQQLIGFIES